VAELISNLEKLGHGRLAVSIFVCFEYLKNYQYKSDKALNIQSFVYLRSNQEAI